MGEFKDKILKLKKDRNAVIIAHNYQLPEIQDVADIVADSLELARRSKSLEADVIVVCGVYFMAETVKILNPDKKVIIPDVRAGCSLASSITARDVRFLREQYPDYDFVAYVNTSAEVKAEVDICCTSANAVEVVNSLENNKIVFLPDRNLGRWVARSVKGKEIVVWDGFCHVHDAVRRKSVESAKVNHTDALVIAHPECRPEVLELADGVCSTSQMKKFVRERENNKSFIIVTESGMIYPLEKSFPDRKFFHIEPEMVCEFMKMITPEKLLNALENLEYEVEVPENIANKAVRAIEKMINVKRGAQ